ncbi:MAG: histidinol-phosphate transaminase [Thermaerobacter sp.]|nr:histidinol-phosphate transaminase [Thermaerobacter sp.]
MLEPRPEIQQLPRYRPGRPEGTGSDPAVNLAANENAWGPSPMVAGCLAELGLHRYPDMAGHQLQGKLSAEWGLASDQLMLGTGSGHLIKCLVEAYVRPGDRVVVTEPTFSLYGVDAQMMGGRVVPLPGDGHAVLFASLPDFVREVRPRLVFACSPNNPTGDAIDEGQLTELIRALPADGLAVVDEAYVHFADKPADALARVRSGEPIAVLRTFSKAYGLAGLRLGVLAAPPEVIAALLRVREPFPASLPALAAAEAALSDRTHLAQVLAATRGGRDRLERELAARGLRVHPGQGNFVWAQVERGSGAELVAALHREGILIRDGAGFGVPSHVRVTVGTPAEIDRLLAALDRIRG